MSPGDRGRGAGGLCGLPGHGGVRDARPRPVDRPGAAAGIVVYLAAGWSVIAAIGLARPDPVRSCHRPGRGAESPGGACVLRLRATYGTPGGATVAGLGLTLAGAVVARTALTATTYLRVTGRQALQQAQTARLVGRPAPALGAVLVEHSTGYARAEPAVSRATRPPGCGYPRAWQGLAARHPRRPMPASARRCRPRLRDRGGRRDTAAARWGLVTSGWRRRCQVSEQRAGHPPCSHAGQGVARGAGRRGGPVPSPGVTGCRGPSQMRSRMDRARPYSCGEASHRRRNAARSAATRPPQTPCWPIVQCRSASSRHAPRTGQAVQIAMAPAASRRAASASVLTGNHSSGTRSLRRRAMLGRRRDCGSASGRSRSVRARGCQASQGMPGPARVPRAPRPWSGRRQESAPVPACRPSPRSGRGTPRARAPLRWWCRCRRAARKARTSGPGRPGGRQVRGRPRAARPGRRGRWPSAAAAIRRESTAARWRSRSR